jgi:hypothetical protein
MHEQGESGEEGEGEWRGRGGYREAAEKSSPQVGRIGQGLYMGVGKRVLTGNIWRRGVPKEAMG